MRCITDPRFGLYILQYGSVEHCRGLASHPKVHSHNF